MAYLTLDRKKLKTNYDYLNKLFKSNGIEWAIVTKMLCGYEPYIKEVLNLGIKEVCDARISNLRKIKEMAPDVETVYIKPPAKRAIGDIVQYADASFNTEFHTIKLLSEEAGRQGKVHKVIIMIELGDLREGVMGDHLMDFYESVFELPNIEVTGIGSNLNCLHGVMPSHDKFIQLSLYKQLIEAKFNRKIPWVTGGTSVVIPLIDLHQLPAGVNHFRVGETLYFGTDLVHQTIFEGMEHDVLRLYAEIIEITEKPVVPIGTMEANPSGETYEINEEDYGRTTHRCILDVGLLDINSDYLIPEDKTFEFVGASSDMLVLDIDDNDQGYKVGDLIPFDLKYMGALTLLNSSYIGKRVI
ncbi:alanine racemase [Owenweeksia hongkongensis]|uniref:alanine racemase n=1 Tax=Owenweeksia hongkongensis TaxID=253245 RepID=UPI003A8E8424